MKHVSLYGVALSFTFLLALPTCKPCPYGSGPCNCDGDGGPDSGDGGGDTANDTGTTTCDPPCGDGEICNVDHCETCPFLACGNTCCGELEQCVEGRCCTGSCEGRVCGTDGCGGTCGECGDGRACDPSGQCCEPQCEGRLCGGDGCGGVCGECNVEQFCVDGGTRCADSMAGAYEHSSRAVQFLGPVLNIEGPYGVALGGGHLLASDANGGTGFPRETPLSSSSTVTIPDGATVRHAFLWVANPIFMRPHDGGEGDYTDDLGGPLDNEDHVRNNGVTFSLNGESFGPFDTMNRQPPGQSELGSDSQISPLFFEPSYGTLTGVKVTWWANRLDVTGLFAGRTGAVDVAVNPPERLELNGNDAIHHADNPAGQTEHNTCSGGASWSLVVIYEQPGAPRQNIVMMDGDWLRAWDYMYFHDGRWQRPAVQIDHAPIAHGARLYLYGTTGGAAGSSIPNFPTCACGCGGQYTLTRGGFMTNAYFSNVYVDPAECRDDPMHRDSTNGPWAVSSGGLTMPIAGNDWTLFQSGDLFTEFPNLFEGHEGPAADNTQPVTNENDANASHDTYGGHPWGGRGNVIYHGTGNSCTVVEIELDPSAIAAGQTTSHLFFRGDQKDVWKPQQIIMVKYIILATPVS